MASLEYFEFVVTARPSWSRIKNLVSEYLKLIDLNSCSVSLVGPAVSDRYGKLVSQMPYGIKINKFNTLQESDELSSVARSCLNGSFGLVQHWEENPPTAVLVIADRTETLGVSVAASIMQIPLVHLQGGETSGSIDDKVRNANTQLADYHLTTNLNTSKKIIQLGKDKDQIEVIGCPSVDLVKQRIERNDNLFELSENYPGVGANFATSDDFGVILFHPDTFDKVGNKYWVECILKTIEESGLNWFWFWPNPDYGSAEIAKVMRARREKAPLNNVRFIINLEPEKFIDLTLRAKVLVGNSSYGIREASFFGLPVLNLGSRQSNRERSENVMDLDIPKVFSNELDSHIQCNFIPTTIYGDGNAGFLGAKALKKWFPEVV